MSALIGLLTAVFRAFPAISSLAEAALEASKKAKAAEALLRKSEKNRLVDEVIDGGGNEGGKSD